MTAIISTAYSRLLGDELRRLRESCTTFTGREMAVHLGWDPSKVSNIELGKVRATEVDLVQFMATCDKNLRYFEDFRDRYRNAFDPCVVPRADNLRMIVMSEAMATKIYSYEVMNLHGLVQTERYARSLFIEANLEPPEEIEKYVQARMERQTILRRPYRPECVFYVHELALRRRLGDAQLMKEQHLRLLHRTHVLRIVPDSVSTFRSPFQLFEFGKASPVVYTETDMAQVFAQDTTAVTRATKYFQRLDALALDEEQSRRMLTEYVNGLRDDFDVPSTGAA
ncbi:helix-turn-helix domain-containing protein [Lentzea alba]|uniref:helix-turn-helix domain-containing protein n=1 Tax=Lentzea alba TaxID=2714351 RepID=UPI0039BF8F06